MAGIYQTISDTIWSEWFWFPANSSWKDLESKGDDFYPQPRHLWYMFPMALLLFILRLLWERWVAYPIGVWYRLRDTPPRKAVPNETLQIAYRKHGKYPPGHAIIAGIAKQASWSPRQVERWWRRRRVQSKPSEMQRFKETSWRFLFYVSVFWYGVGILWNKQWLWDTRHCWYGFPHQILTQDVFCYYIVELGFYWSLIFSLFMDVRRKDFPEQIVHHMATISLMVLSYCNNMVRVGSLVLLVHDAVDYWMEGGKLTKYLRYPKVTDSIFIVFVVMWFVTRLYIYPMYILHSTLVEAPGIVGMYPMYWIYNLLLCLLQCLHVFWFGLILKMVFKYIRDGQVDKDERSETEPETNSEDEGIILNNNQGKLDGLTHRKLNGKHHQEDKITNGDLNSINSHMFVKNSQQNLYS